MIQPLLRGLLLVLLFLTASVGRLWAQVHTETHYGVTYNVVYLRNGGTGNGESSATPVGTWANAYKKLVNTGDRDYDWEHNVIVIVGNMQLNFKEGDTKDISNNQGTPATITGVWPWDTAGNATTTQITNGGGDFY